MDYMLLSQLSAIRERYQPTAFYLGRRQIEGIRPEETVPYFGDQSEVLGVPFFVVDRDTHIGFSVDVSEYWPVRK